VSAAICGNRGYLLTNEANNILGKDRHIINASADLEALDVLASYNGFNTWELKGLTHIDALDAAVWDGAS
jgi:hypothetical protein